MMDPAYDNRPRRSTSPDSNSSSDEYHSDGEDIKPQLPPKKKRQQRGILKSRLLWMLINNSFGF